MRLAARRRQTESGAAAAVPSFGVGSTVRAAAPWLALALYFACFLRVSWRIGDEGSIVHGAERVMRGELPYRDFFEVIGPGAFYSLALWFKALGISWLTTRLAILASGVGSVAAVYVITRRFCQGSLAAIPAALYAVLSIPLWPGASHHFDSNLWILWSVALVVRRERPAPTRMFVAGVLAGIGSTFIPQKGGMVVAGMIVGSAAEAWIGAHLRRCYSSAGALIGGFAAVGCMVLLYFWSKSGLDALVYAMAIWPRQQYHTVNSLAYAYGLTQWFWTDWLEVIGTVAPSSVSTAVTAILIAPLAGVAILPAGFALCVFNRLLNQRKRHLPATELPWTLWASTLR